MIFNYIITIHNKEFLIQEVLNSAIKCCRKNSFIYPVLDGCTDNTERIIDQIIENNRSVNIVKVYAQDVHEILSINEGLKFADQSQPGYNIIMQDDVVLLDYELENKITNLYEIIGEKLAYVSFRLGANIKDYENLTLVDLAENAYGHGIDNTKILLPGQFVFKDIAIKSPVCIPTKIINQYGFLDEQLAPCFHDDTEYCLRMIMNGLRNGVYAIKYESELDWGGTRKSPNPKYETYIKNNLNYIKKKYSEVIHNLIDMNRLNDPICIVERIEIQDLKEAKRIYKNNQNKRKKFESKDMNLSEKFYYYVTRSFLRNCYNYIIGLTGQK